MPITASLIVAGGIAAGKGIQSAIRANRAKKQIEDLQKNLVEPKYQLPKEMMEMYANLKGQGIQREMPGMGNMRNAQDLQMAAMLGDIGTMGGGSAVDRMAALQGAYQNRMAGEQQIGFENAQFQQAQREQRQRDMMALQQQIAGQRGIQYQQNQLNPFLRTSAAISALREKRYQESNNAFDAFSNAAMTAAGGVGGGGGANMGSFMNAQNAISSANNAAGSITNAGSMQNSQLGNYGNPAGGSGMGGQWQNQIGATYGGGYYDPYLQTWIPG
jgi:hypothetical protein